MKWDADVTEWRKALAWYPTAIKEYAKSLKTKEGLVALDKMLWVELGTAIMEREPSYIQADEYRRVVEWKLKRGKWRPRLQKFADELSPDLIKTHSEKALACLEQGNTRKAVFHLVELRGCGPATASAVLAACDNSIPFMSDELLVSIPCFKGQRDYSLATYMTLIEEVQLKCDELGEDWNARDIERAIFAGSVAYKLNLTKSLESASTQNSAAEAEKEQNDVLEISEESESKPVTRSARRKKSSQPEVSTIRKLRTSKRRRN